MSKTLKFNPRIYYNNIEYSLDYGFNSIYFDNNLSFLYISPYKLIFEDGLEKLNHHCTIYFHEESIFFFIQIDKDKNTIIDNQIIENGNQTIISKKNKILINHKQLILDYYEYESINDLF